MTADRSSLLRLLNVSTPHAPTSEEEIRARLATPPPVTHEPPQAAPPPAAEAVKHRPVVAPVVAVPAPPRPEEPDHDDLERRLALARERLADLDRALAGRVVESVSRDGAVRVVAGVHGGILSIQVDPRSARGHQARDLGRSLTEAIREARRAGAALTDRVTAEIFPGGVPDAG